MSRFLSVLPARALRIVLLLGGVFSAGNAISDVTYEVRAQTKDQIKNALVFDSSTNTYSYSKAKQGSFGAPSINDKGTLAYACILSGEGITASTNFSVALRVKGNKPAVVAMQSGVLVDDSFLTAGARYPQQGRLLGGTQLYRGSSRSPTTIQ
jgi:hypothetical protein